MKRGERLITYPVSFCLTISFLRPPCLPCIGVSAQHWNRCHGLDAYRFPPFNHQTIQLEELTDNSLSLSEPKYQHHIPVYSNTTPIINSSPCSISAFQQLRSTPLHYHRTSPFLSGPKSIRSHTFMPCNSRNPFCINSCFCLSSCTPLCSRKASRVRRFAYSRKLYAANCSPCRNNWRY